MPALALFTPALPDPGRAGTRRHPVGYVAAMRVRHLILTVAVLASMSACASGDDAGDTTDTAASTTEAPVTDPPATDPVATEPPATDPAPTEPPATEPPTTDAPVTAPTSDVLAAALPTASDLGAGWTAVEGEPFLDPPADEGPGLGACGGANASARAAEHGVVGIARTPGFTREDPGSFSSTTLFSFPSDEDASGFVERSVSAHDCPDGLTWELVEGPGEDQFNGFADGFAAGEIWVHVGDYSADPVTTEADEAAILRTVLDRRLTIEDVVFGETVTDLVVLERHGNLVVSTVLSGQCCQTGYLNLDTIPVYTPTDEDAIAHATPVAAAVVAGSPGADEHPSGWIDRRSRLHRSDPVTVGARTPTMAEDRSPTERLLRQTEERFRTIFTNAPTGISITDWEGRFEQCNPAYASMVGIAPEDLVDRSFPDLVHPDDRETNMALTAALQRGEIPHFEIENRYLRPDGTEVWVHKFVSTIAHEGGEPSHLLAIVTDITERRRYDQELRESEERFRATFELAPIGVAHVGLDGTFVRVNEALATITGYDRARLETIRFPDITHPDDIDEDLAHVGRLLSGEISSYSMEKRYIRPDGTVVWVNLTGTLVRDPDAEPAYFVAVVEDVTDRRAAREHLARVAESEHQIALRLQQALLPDHLASTETLSVAGRYVPADTSLRVGGDWYDSILLPDGRLLLVVGDVVGHGLDAAAVMGRLRAGLAALTARESRPSALLTAFDEFARGPQGADFATVCCAVVDPTDGTLLHASAGHPPVLIVGADGSTRWLDDATSPPLCHANGQPRIEGADRLAPGETIVL